MRSTLGVHSSRRRFQKRLLGLWEYHPARKSYQEPSWVYTHKELIEYCISENLRCCSPEYCKITITVEILLWTHLFGLRPLETPDLP